LQHFIARQKTELRPFLAETLGLSGRKAKDLVDSKLVFVNDKRVWIATYLLRPGDRVDVVVPKEETAPEPVILHEDEWIIAVDKPAGVVTESDPASMEARLRKTREDNRIRAIHRLDKETSGVVLFAKTDEVHGRFVELWSDKEVRKLYLAVSYGEADFDARTVKTPVDGKSALSHVKTISRTKDFSCFEVEIETGRKYQVRKHLAVIRHPVVGDKSIGVKVVISAALKNVRRQMLHAWKISFVHPFTGQKLALTAPVPQDMAGLIKELGLRVQEDR
jgi:23S rRNA pseudouridine1911/1915/1917 synthase